jgi:hypothetical protein
MIIFLYPLCTYLAGWYIANTTDINNYIERLKKSCTTTSKLKWKLFFSLSNTYSSYASSFHVKFSLVLDLVINKKTTRILFFSRDKRDIASIYDSFKYLLYRCNHLSFNNIFLSSTVSFLRLFINTRVQIMKVHSCRLWLYWCLSCQNYDSFGG